MTSAFQFRTRKKKTNPLLLDEAERGAMRAACRFNSQLMDYVRTLVKPGVSTGAIDEAVYHYTRQHGHVPACLGYKDFPATICTSINEVVCHGIPRRDQVLKQGDIVNID